MADSTAYARIPARPTTYKGIKMRSRLEAGYAAYLDHSRVAWEYEPECFGDELGQYLPDFRVKTPTDTFYIEIKPNREQAERAGDRMRIIHSSEPGAHLVIRYPIYCPDAYGWESDEKWRGHISIPAATVDPSPEAWETYLRSRFSDVDRDGSLVSFDCGEWSQRVALHIADAETVEAIAQAALPGLKCSPPDWVSEGPPSYAPATFTHVPDMWNLIAGPRIPDARFVEFQEDREITDTYTGQTFMDMTAWML